MAVDFNRRAILLTSLALGIYTLLIVPVYSLFINPRVCEVSPFTCLSGVKFLGGESPLILIFSLVTIPLLATKGRRNGALAVLVLNLIFVTTEWRSVGLPPLVQALSFARPMRCYLFGGNCLDHNLFHLSHIPFYLVMAFYSYRAYRVEGRRRKLIV